MDRPLAGHLSVAHRISPVSGIMEITGSRLKAFYGALTREPIWVADGEHVAVFGLRSTGCVPHCPTSAKVSSSVATELPGTLWPTHDHGICVRSALIR